MLKKTTLAVAVLFALTACSSGQSVSKSTKSTKSKDQSVSQSTESTKPKVEYDKIYYYYKSNRSPNSYAVVEKNGQRGLIDESGNLVLQFVDYRLWQRVEDGRFMTASTGAIYERGTKYGVLELNTNKIVIPFIYTTAPHRGENGFFTAKRGGKSELYITENNEEYTHIGDLVDDRRYVCQRYSDAPYRCGFVDGNRKLVIPLQYTSADDFSEGLAAVTNSKNKCGFIDRNGQLVIGYKYDVCFSFENGKARVILNDGLTPADFYIDKTGKQLTQRKSLATWRQRLKSGDNTDEGMVVGVKGNMVKVQYTDSQCTQRDYRNICQNYIDTLAEKWIKRSNVYPTDH